MGGTEIIEELNIQCGSVPNGPCTSEDTHRQVDTVNTRLLCMCQQCTCLALCWTCWTWSQGMCPQICVLYFHLPCINQNLVTTHFCNSHCPQVLMQWVITSMTLYRQLWNYNLWEGMTVSSVDKRTGIHTAFDPSRITVSDRNGKPQTVVTLHWKANKDIVQITHNTLPFYVHVCTQDKTSFVTPYIALDLYSIWNVCHNVCVAEMMLTNFTLHNCKTKTPTSRSERICC